MLMRSLFHPSASVLALVAFFGTAGLASPVDVELADSVPATSASDVPSAAESEVRVSLEQPIVDLGVVPHAERRPARFELRNQSEVSATITGVDVVPGLEIDRFDRTIPPGGVGEIEVVLDATKVQGDVSLAATIRVDGRGQPLRAAVQARVKNYFGAFPGYARWLYVRGEPVGTIKQVMWPVDGEDFEVLEVVSPHPDISVSFRRARDEEVREEQPEPQWVVEATLERSARVGPITGVIEVRTDHPVQSRLLIPASGFVRPKVAVTPPRGTFEAIEVGEDPVERYFHLKVFQTEPVGIESLSLDPPLEGAETSVETVQHGREYQVWVKLLPGAAKGVYKGVLKVHTDHEKVGIVEIPLAAKIE